MLQLSTALFKPFLSPPCITCINFHIWIRAALRAASPRRPLPNSGQLEQGRESRQRSAVDVQRFGVIREEGRGLHGKLAAGIASRLRGILGRFQCGNQTIYVVKQDYEGQPCKGKLTTDTTKGPGLIKIRGVYSRQFRSRCFKKFQHLFSGSTNALPLWLRAS